ncbi:MAG TPA: molybdate ABC transporter permease subunit [Burkholderiaceae bacterium]|jgi:molybdate transport system permease protein|nr:molybdate ABC transporter permease subunit [Burkholderiaceae bacterium]
MLTVAELDALRLSLQVGLVAVALGLPLAVLCAWLLARYQFPGKTLFDAVIHLPLVLPPVVIGYFLLVLFGTHGPIGGWLYETFGLRLIFTRWGAALAAAVMSFPLLVRAIRLALEAVDRNLEAAARTLGASRFDVFFNVTLPLMLPGIVSGGIVAFAAALGDFGATITFVGNVQGETQTLSLAIYSLTQTPDGDAAAARLVLISLTLALVALFVSELLARRVRRFIGRA